MDPFAWLPAAERVGLKVADLADNFGLRAEKGEQIFRLYLAQGCSSVEADAAVTAMLEVLALRSTCTTLEDIFSSKNRKRHISLGRNVHRDYSNAGQRN
jgi:hypothetical protein